MAEEEKKPTTITLKLTIPTQESIIEGLKQMFPMVTVEVEGEEEKASPDHPE